MEGFFSWLGQALGDTIRFMTTLMDGLATDLRDAGRGFLQGLSESLGLPPVLINLALVLLSLWLLWKSLRAFVRRMPIAGLVWLGLGVLMFNWQIK